MNKTTEALKLAEKYLTWLCDPEQYGNDVPITGSEALAVIREALAGDILSPTEPTNMNLNCKSVQARLATSWGYVKAEPVKREPVACVTGYYGGRCVIEPIDRACVLPTNMSLYAAPVDAKAIRADEREKVMNEPLTKEMWERFRSEVRAEALEEAAKVCDEAIKHDWNIPHKPALVNCAAAIRGLK